MNRIRASKYVFRSKLGDVSAKARVTVYDDGISAENFDQEMHQHSLDANEIRRLTHLAAVQFLDQNYTKLRYGGLDLNSETFAGIMAFLGVNGPEMAFLLRCGKAKITKILRKTQSISPAQVALTADILMREVVRPGHARYVLDRILHTKDASPPEPANKTVINKIKKINEQADIHAAA